MSEHAIADTPTPTPSAQYDLTVDLTPATGRLSVEGRLEIASPPGGRLLLRLDPIFVIRTFTVDGTARTPQRNGAIWSVELDATQPRHQLSFAYDGDVPPPPANGTEAAALMAGIWGALLEEDGGWYPHLMGTPARFTTRVTTPRPLRAVTTGLPTDESEDDTHITVTYDTLAPVVGLSLFAGRWQVAEKTATTPHGPVLVRTWLRAHQSDLTPTYLDAAARHVATYTATIGAYPFGAFHVVAAPFPVGLGYPGLTYLGERVLPFRFVPETSLRHEVLHTWWGNGIEIDYAHGNWAEGLTTYMADYARAREQGADVAREMRLEWLRDFAALPQSEDHAPIHFTNKSHDASQIIGYNKIAFFFHMLERTVGKATFETAIADFWQTWKHQVAGWNDIEAVFAKASGRDLAPLFDQWLGRTGAPELDLRDVQAAPTQDGFAIRFTLAQTQEAPAFALDVPVVLETRSGRTTRTVRLDSVRKTFLLTSASPPRALHIDPDYDLFRRLRPQESPPIFRDVTLNPKTRTVIATPHDDAARDLARAVLSAAPDVISKTPEDAITTPLLVIADADTAPHWLSPPAALTAMGADEFADALGAQVWVGRTANGHAVMVVRADTPEALEQAARRLPHYGRKSYLRLMPGMRGQGGVLAVTNGPLSHRF